MIKNVFLSPCVEQMLKKLFFKQKSKTSMIENSLWGRSKKGSTQRQIKVFAGHGQFAFWGPLDKHKSKK
jgi:hypothetical protein